MFVDKTECEVCVRATRSSISIHAFGDMFFAVRNVKVLFRDIKKFVSLLQLFFDLSKLLGGAKILLNIASGS